MNKQRLFYKIIAILLCLVMLSGHSAGQLSATVLAEDTQNGDSIEDVSQVTEALPTPDDVTEFVENGGFSGQGTKEAPYEIGSARELAMLSAMINYQVGVSGFESGFSGIYFKQTADIDLSCYDCWIPIGLGNMAASTTNGNWWNKPADSSQTDRSAFRGYYDGDGKTVSHMTIDVGTLWEMLTTGSYYEYLSQKPSSSSNRGFFAVGLFGRIYLDETEGVSVQNLTVENASITLDEYFKNIYARNVLVGGIVGHTDSMLYNLTARNITIDGSAIEEAYVGGTNSSNQNNATHTYGSIAGSLSGLTSGVQNSKVIGCTVTIQAPTNITEGGKVFAGGLAGRAERGNAACSIQNNYILGTSVTVYDSANGKRSNTDKVIGLYKVAASNISSSASVGNYLNGKITNLDSLKNLLVDVTAIEYNGPLSQTETTDSGDTYVERKLSYNKLDANLLSVEVKEDESVLGAYTLTVKQSNQRGNALFMDVGETTWTVRKSSEETAEILGEKIEGESITLDPYPQVRKAISSLFGYDFADTVVPKLSPILLLDWEKDEEGHALYKASLSALSITMGEGEQAILNPSYTWTLMKDDAVTKTVTGTSSFDLEGDSLSQGETLTCTLTFTYYEEAYVLTKEAYSQTIVYVDQTRGSDGNYGGEDAPIKTIERAFALLNEINPQGSARENVIVIQDKYLTASAGTDMYGRSDRSDCDLIVFPELLQGHTPLLLDSSTKNITQEMLDGQVGGLHVNATIRGETEDVVINIVTPTGSTERGLLQFSNLIFEDIELHFYNSDTVGENLNTISNNRVDWYCNGYDLELGSGVKITGIRDTTSGIANGIPSAFLEANPVQDLSIIAASFTSLPITAALTGEMIGEGEDGGVVLDMEKLGNKITISSGTYGRVMGGGRSGDTMLPNMYVKDTSTGEYVKPYNRSWLYGKTTDSVRKGDMKYLWQSDIEIGGDAIIGLVAGGQTDSIYMGSSYVVIGGNAIIGVAIAGSIGYGQNMIKPWCSTFYANARYAFDFKGNSSLTVTEGSQAVIWNLYGGCLGRNNDDRYRQPYCAMRGESITLTVLGGTILYDLFSAGAGGTVGIYTETDGVISVDAPCNIYTTIGGTAVVTRDVYGGGDGYYEYTLRALHPRAGFVFGDIDVKIQGAATVGGNVYGGGQGVTGEEGELYQEVYNLAQTYGKITVEILGEAIVGGDVFGGGRGAVGKDTVLYQDMAKVTGETDVIITGGTIRGSVYGGGESGRVVGTDLTTYRGTSHVYMTGGTIEGELYGGGKSANIEPFKDENYTGTLVVLTGGDVMGRIFAGCQAADVYGFSKVMILGGEYHDVVYGGNNESGTVEGTLVYVASREGLEAPILYHSLFGGGLGLNTMVGNLNSHSGTFVRIGDRTEDMDVQDPDSILEKDSPDAEDYTYYFITAVAHELIQDQEHSVVSGLGERILQFPAGSDEAYTINNQFTIYNRIYGGGEYGLTQTTNVLVYGGNISRNGDGHVGITVHPSIFGGGYGGVSAYASADEIHTVANAEHTNLVIGEKFTSDIRVYGGGELASVGLSNASILAGNPVPVTDDYTYASQVLIKDHANLSTAVYGGGRGETGTTYAKVWGDTSVTVTGHATIYGEDSTVESNDNTVRLYGGARDADISGSTHVFIKGHARVDRAYGGNENSGNIEGNTYVTVTEAPVINRVLGGGYAADLEGTAYVNIEGSIYPGTSTEATQKIQELYEGAYEQVMTTLLLHRENNDAEGYPVAESVFGGGYQANVGTSIVTVSGGLIDTVYGGGRNGDVETAKVYIKPQATICQDVYGGCKNSGLVETAKVYVGNGKESGGRIRVYGSVFGAGYGVDTESTHTQVTINLPLKVYTIARGEDESGATYTGNPDDYDFMVTETGRSIDNMENSGGVDQAYEWNSESKDTISYIGGSVYGGGNMGTVGEGAFVGRTTQTTQVTLPGDTDVRVLNGTIQGSVYGGGSGVPEEGSYRTTDMGAVFGCTSTYITSGVVGGNVYGGGDQSRTISPDGVKATVVTIKEEEGVTNDEDGRAAVILGSIFGGGNTVEGSTHATFYTTYGDTQVNIEGLSESTASTLIYLFGGIYGAGNLCRVSGKREVNISNFHFNTKNYELLKTLKSIQRADVLNLTNTRVVLDGALDLVSSVMDETLYSLNRIGQLNMYQSSTVKLCTIVNELGGLRSDQNTATTYIDHGNNSKNNYTVRGGTSHEDVALNNVVNTDQIEAYQEAYEAYKAGIMSADDEEYTSFNVVCVANGRYLEIKSDGVYGNVEGLFCLELLHANPGEGGGYVYAAIGEKGDAENAGSTGDFICCTLDGDSYMVVEDDTGGYDADYTSEWAEDGDYTYYYWYIVGRTYRQTFALTDLISATANDTIESIPVNHVEEKYTYALKVVTGDTPTNQTNISSAFSAGAMTDTWNDTLAEGDFYAIELRVVKNGDEETAETLGFLIYDSEKETWGIRMQNSDGTPGDFISGVGEDDSLSGQDNKDLITANMLYQVEEESDIRGLTLQFVLHKGAKVTSELDEVPLQVVVNGYAYNEELDTYDTDRETTYIFDFTTTIQMLIPMYSIQLEAGHHYSSILGDKVHITGTSSFTAEMITDYVPAVYGGVSRSLTVTDKDYRYLLDETTGIAFTIEEPSEPYVKSTLVFASEGTEDLYSIYEDESGKYFVRYYQNAGGSDQTVIHELTLTESTFTSEETKMTVLPKGTKITLVAAVNDYAPTYWYYYCEEDVSEISLDQFVSMNQNLLKETQEDASVQQVYYSLSNATGGRITEDYTDSVSEELIYVIDFADVEDGWSSTREDTLQVRTQYLYKSAGNFLADIADYVIEEKKEEADGTVTISYDRHVPEFSEIVSVSGTKDGIQEFSITVDEGSQNEGKYGMKDTVTGTVTITQTTDYVNTQIFKAFDGRSYSVKIELLDQYGNRAKFPMGTTIECDGASYGVGKDCEYIILPVITEGDHPFSISTLASEGFEAGAYTLSASLYSSPVDGYYNEMDTSHRAEDTLAIEDNVTRSLLIAGGTRLVYSGKDMTVILRTQTSEVSITEHVGIALYRYDSSTVQDYEGMDLFEVFASDTMDRVSVEKMADENIWKATLLEDAKPGTYRLEWTYYDHVEYWDFILVP